MSDKDNPEPQEIADEALDDATGGLIANLGVGLGVRAEPRDGHSDSAKKFLNDDPRDPVVFEPNDEP